MKMTVNQDIVYDYIVRNGDSKVSDISLSTGLAKSSVWRAIDSLRRYHRKVRVARYITGKSNVQVLYSAGSGDVRHPYDPQIVLDYLTTIGPACRSTLMQELGWNWAMVQRVTDKLHKSGLIHCSGYDRHVGVSGGIGQIFSYGPGIDAKKPRANKKFIAKRYRKNNRLKLAIKSRVYRGSKVGVWTQLEM